jgi:biotin carboxyl carrier protein
VKYEVNLTAGGNTKTRAVELIREDAHWNLCVDGESVPVDAIEIAPNIFSIILGGKSYEVRVTPKPAGQLTLQVGEAEFSAEVVDPRAWSGRRHSHLEAEGRQPVVAPMPGKVVRILAKEGDSVEAGQGIFVVEAMKMQNEVRSPKSGVVEKLAVSEGQAVNAGDVLAWVD